MKDNILDTKKSKIKFNLRRVLPPPPRGVSVATDRYSSSSFPATSLEASVPSLVSYSATSTTALTTPQTPAPQNLPPRIPNPWDRSVEQKRLLIRKQLVVLLHAMVCRRRDLARPSNMPIPTCIVPFCSLMKNILSHLNNCKNGRSCTTTHCSSSRQILLHWKHCVKTECPVCVSLRQVIPTSLLSIFPNPLCRAEILNRVASQQRTNETSRQEQEQHVPEIMQCEE